VRGIVAISFILIVVRVFWDMTPYSKVEGYRRFKEKYSHYHMGRLSYRTKTISFEISVHISQTIRLYALEDSTIHDYRYENLQPYTSFDLVLLSGMIY
jgi:hypothetical protein